MDSEEGSTKVHLNISEERRLKDEEEEEEEEEEGVEEEEGDVIPSLHVPPLSFSDSSRGTSNRWHCFGYTFPRREVVYICQTLIVYIVILACLVNLTLGHSESSNLWIALLSSCLGYMLPQPSMGDNGSFLHNPT